MFTDSPRTWNGQLVHRKKCAIVWNFSPVYSTLLKLKWVDVVTYLEIAVPTTGSVFRLDLCFSRNNFSLSVKLMFAGLWQGSATDTMINDLLMTLQTYLHAWMCLNAFNVLNTEDLSSCFPARPHDFFDAQTLDAIRHRAICFNLSAHIESLGKGHSVVFHSTVSMYVMHSLCLPVSKKSSLSERLLFSSYCCGCWIRNKQ